MRFKSNAVVAEQLGDDVFKRVRLGLGDMCPADKRLEEMLRYWSDLRSGGRLPARPQIDHLALKPMMGWIHVVDTTAPSPGRYFYRLWGSSVRLDSGKDHTRMTLGDCPWPLLRDGAMQDYGNVVATGEPTYHLISHTIDYTQHSIARLLLPLASDGRRVDQLLVLINERPLPCLEDEDLIGVCRA
jgi:hypothetical protein